MAITDSAGVLKKGVALANYIITGECDDVCAKLKTTLKAQDAKFDANLEAQFKSPATPPRQFKPAPTSMPPRKPVAAVAAPTGKPTSSTGSLTGSMLSTNRNSDDSLRGRMRTSLRTTPSR